jgi:hypothetical protein
MIGRATQQKGTDRLTFLLLRSSRRQGAPPGRPTAAHASAPVMVSAPRQNRRGTTDPAGKATTATDPAGKMRSGQRNDGSSREGRSNRDPARKAAAATDPAKAMKGVGGGAGPAGQRPAPVLAGGSDNGDERSSISLHC